MPPLDRVLAYAGLAASLLFVSVIVAHAETTRLNVSFGVARELYQVINPAFAEAYKASTGERITINPSHSGSSKQALADCARSAMCW